MVWVVKERHRESTNSHSGSIFVQHTECISFNVGFSFHFAKISACAMRFRILTAETTREFFFLCWKEGDVMDFAGLNELYDVVAFISHSKNERNSSSVFF